MKLNWAIRFIAVLLITVHLTPLNCFTQVTTSNSPKPLLKQKVLVDQVKKPIDYVLIKKNLQTIKTENGNWDYKLLNTQLEDIFRLILFRNNKEINDFSLQAIVKLFIENFESCDKDRDNLLSIEEFRNCIQTNKYFETFLLTTQVQLGNVMKIVEENKQWTGIDSTIALADKIFKFLDSNKNDNLNFYEFMMIRLIAFSLKRCNNFGFFINEVAFECAIEIVSDQRSYNRDTARNLFNFSMSLSNFEGTRELDLPTFVQISLQSRLFGKVNGKENLEITRSDFNAALDSGALPLRYKSEYIDVFFRLSSVLDKKNEGIDIYSFVFMDQLLSLYTEGKSRVSKGMTYEQFHNSLGSISFSKKLIEPLFHLNRFKITIESFKTIMTANIPKYYSEEDFMLRFRSLNKIKLNSAKTSKGEEKTENKEDKVSQQVSNDLKQNDQQTASKSQTTTTTTTTTTKIVKKKVVLASWKNSAAFYLKHRKGQFDANFVTKWIFTLFHKNNLISFEDYLYFIQITYVYRLLPHKGHASGDSLFNHFHHYSGHPKVAQKLYKYSENFKLFDDHTMISLYYTYALLKIDDIVADILKTDLHGNLLNEINVRVVLSRMGISNYPKGLLDSCIKVMNFRDEVTNVPMYDWTCVLKKIVTTVSRILEAAESHRVVKEVGLSLDNTDIHNVDKNILL